ncbi:MAG: hypothetical protein M3Q07_26810 [Pseudobdellovibrionaceae bacterium]|nr:hypothetical protein [Pseudobdellovibrionaceae bacterium]
MLQEIQAVGLKNGLKTSTNISQPTTHLIDLLPTSKIHQFRTHSFLCFHFVMTGSGQGSGNSRHIVVNTKRSADQPITSINRVEPGA